MDKIQTDADSCAADFEDIHSRSVDLVRTLEEDVANKAVWVGGLVSAGPKAPGREGSAYDLIRYVRVRSIGTGKHLSSTSCRRRIGLSLVSLCLLVVAGNVVAVAVDVEVSIVRDWHG